MDWKAALTVFLTVFLAELGDKTQIATALFAAKRTTGPGLIFCSAALALVASTALAVAAGALASDFVDSRIVSYLAGCGFIGVGVWTLWTA